MSYLLTHPDRKVHLGRLASWMMSCSPHGTARSNEDVLKLDPMEQFSTATFWGLIHNLLWVECEMSPQAHIHVGCLTIAGVMISGGSGYFRTWGWAYRKEVGAQRWVLKGILSTAFSFLPSSDSCILWGQKPLPYVPQSWCSFCLLWAQTHQAKIYDRLNISKL